MTGGLCLLLWLAVLVSSCSGFTAQASEQKSGKQRKDHEFCVVRQAGAASRPLTVHAKGSKYIARETQKKTAQAWNNKAAINTEVGMASHLGRGRLLRCGLWELMGRCPFNCAHASLHSSLWCLWRRTKVLNWAWWYTPIISALGW